MLPGILHELTGCTAPCSSTGCPIPDRPHFTVFDYETLHGGLPQSGGVRLVAGAGRPGQAARSGVTNSMLSMGGAQHKRYRALVQPSFLPANGKWWAQNWISETVDAARRRVGARRARRTQRRLLRGHPAAHHHRQLRRAHRAGPRDPAVRCARSAEGRRHAQADRRGAPRATAGRPDQHSGPGRAHRRRRRHGPAHRSGDRLLRAAVARRGLGHHLEADGHHAHRAAAASGPRSRRCAPTGSCCAPPSRRRCGGCRPIRCSPAG